MKQDYYVALFAIVIFIATLVGAIYWSATRAPLKEQVPPAENLRAESGRTVFDAGNFSFKMPAKWTLNAEVSSPNIKDAEVLFALTSDTQSCIIAYLRAPNDSLAIPPLTQVSFAKRIFTQDGDQLDSNWWVAKADAPVGFSFMNDVRTPLLGEMHLINYPYSQSDTTTRAFFALYDKDHGSVAEVCEENFLSFAESLSAHYDTTSLSPDTKGELFIQTDVGVAMLALRGEDSIIRHLQRLVFDSLPPVPAVYKNELYFASQRAIVKHNPWMGQDTVIPSTTQPEGEQVNAFHIANDTLFYLAGRPCTEYMGRCDGRLIAQNLDGTGRQELASGVVANTIVGFSAEENALYLAKSFGDAGCFSYEIFLYRFTEKVTGTTTYSGCAGDEGYDYAMKGFTAFTSRFEQQQIFAPYALISQGALTAPISEIYQPPKAQFIRFFQ